VRPVRTACDLHLHSSASSANDEWYSASFGCPESYADPVAQYEMCKRRGMSLVTLTDHDTIAGGLQLLDRPDFFLSEEITTYFPEDRCALHVLAWNITPAHHDRIQAVRGNVYDLVELLRRERITHACAHPLFSPNSKLSVAALERILVLFPILEGTNGLTDRRLADPLHAVLAGLDPAALDRIAARHDLVRDPAWQRHVLTAGSDAHATRHCASCSTVVEARALGAGEFLEAVAAGQASCTGEQADLARMQLTASNVTYRYLSGRTEERPDYRDPFIDLLDVVTGRETGARPPTGMRDEFVRSLIAGAARSSVPVSAELDDDDTSDERVMATIRGINDGVVGRALDELVDAVNDLDMYRLLGAVRDLAGAAATATPFLFSARHFSKQWNAAYEVLSRWDASPPPELVKRLAVFSDTVDQINGVTTSIRRFVRRARAHGTEVRVPYCGEAPADLALDVYSPLPGATTRALAIYDGMNFHVPSLLGTIEWLWRERITHVELATPGPMGFVGLLAARLLGLPVTASYHTELPELCRQLSDNAWLHAAARHVVSWFYRRVDRVFVFSACSQARLLELGIPAAKIEPVAVGIDPEEFSPRFACPHTYPLLGVRTSGRVVLSVSRLSREKNLPLVIEAIERLQMMEDPPTLVVVGDGPEGEALRASCTNRPWVVFVGAQSGDALRRLYASASAFVFASMIDTLGLVTMEAMASGLPVLVPRGAAITELVEDGHTGYCYEPTAAALAATLRQVLESPSRDAVARNARAAMVRRWEDIQRRDVWHALAGARA
jgi:glycosyltransferase involved in cell wall biosynthesis